MMNAALTHKESKGMEDNLIFVLSLTIFAYFLLDIFNAHLFGLEALIAIGNTILTMYYYYKNRK